MLNSRADSMTRLVQPELLYTCQPSGHICSSGLYPQSAASANCVQLFLYYNNELPLDELAGG